MESFSDIAPLWDLSQATNFSQLPDDDFLALLQKQFPGASHLDGNIGFGDGVNPQNISQYSLPGVTPPSDDSSPSPPTGTNGDSRKQSPEAATEDSPESALKRKASSEDLEEGPSQKNPHTASGSRKSSISATKRKTSGSGPDETRLLKRKEQNRAAQRAFRERKEKHVKDLEDKVAALEAKNEQATTENENLRDLLSRLQTENMALRQSSFTFSVPKTAASTSSAKSSSFTPDTSLFSKLPRITYTAPDPTKFTNPLDVTSMMSFDPNVLNLLEESPQSTATDGASLMDFGFGNNESSFNPSNYTTIASNPTFFSLASVFDHAAPPPLTPSTTSSPSQPSTSNDQSSFGFDFNSLTPWPTSSSNTHDAGTLDDLFGGFLNSQQHMDVNAFLTAGTPSSISPVVHHQNLNLTMGSPATSASSSPASHNSDPLFSTRESSSSESDAGEECPKTKAEFCRHIATSGPSAFVNAAEANPNSKLVPAVSCQGGTAFPSVEKSEQNVPVLDAWRNITRDPQYKECDITSLCAEFASKARCDGSKVVLEPQGMNNIMEALAAKKWHQQQ